MSDKLDTAVTPLTIDDVNRLTLQERPLPSTGKMREIRGIAPNQGVTCVPDTVREFVESQIEQGVKQFDEHLRTPPPIQGSAVGGGLTASYYEGGAGQPVESMTASDDLAKAWAAESAEFRRVVDAGRLSVEPRHWEKPLKKIVTTLNIGDYQPAIRELTYPLMYAYAQKIGADFCEITTRKYPDWPIVMEKLQCADICRDAGADWVIYFDADALVSREMFDPTDHISKAEVCFNGKDMSGIRSRPDKYFRRDGRYIGACSWFMVASDWTASDLWRLPDGLTFEECQRSMFTSIQEHNGGQFKDSHLIDDYVHSRNIAQYGLRHKQFMDICGQLGWRDQFGRGANPFAWHTYSVPYEQKIQGMLTKLSTPQDRTVDIGGGRDAGPGWQMMAADDVRAFKARWGLK